MATECSCQELTSRQSSKWLGGQLRLVIRKLVSLKLVSACFSLQMLSSSRAFIVVCDGSFSSDFDGPGHDCSAIHSIARDGSSGFYTLDTPCDIPPIMQLLGCSAFGGAVSGFPEGSGDSFTAR
jgi:hypothetical protein